MVTSYCTLPCRSRRHQHIGAKGGRQRTKVNSSTLFTTRCMRPELWTHDGLHHLLPVTLGALVTREGSSDCTDAEG